MTTSIQCPPGTRRVGMECIPLEGVPSGQSQREYYRQYLQDLPAYDTPGQGAYTGMGTDAFHPLYGQTRSNKVLSTPLQTDYSNLNLSGVPGYAGGKPSSLGVDGYAGGRSGYSSADVASGHRVRETPKRMDAPFSMGDPYGQGGSLWNVGRLMENRVDPYGGVDPTLLYDLRRNAAGGADLPPGYTAGLGRTTPSEGYISVKDLVGGAPGMGGAPGLPAGAPGMGGGGLFNLGGLLGGGTPAGGAPSMGGGGLFGGIGAGAPAAGAPGGGSGAPSRGGKGAGRAKKSGGMAKRSSSGLVGGMGTAP